MAFKRFVPKSTSGSLATTSSTYYSYDQPTWSAPSPTPTDTTTSDSMKVPIYPIVIPEDGGPAQHSPTPITPSQPPPSEDLDGNGVPDYIDKQNRDAAQRNAMEMLRLQFKQYGIDDPTFTQYILTLLQQGYDAGVVSLMLQDHKAYKERFQGNELRRSRGLGVLSPAEYLATEAAYAQILRAAGLPAGFYDDPRTDFAQWIGKDVSPHEIKTRADMAAKRVHETDPSVRQALASYYGITDGTLAAYFLDEKRALPILQRQAQAAEIGAAASRQGLARTARADAELYADQGVTGDQAARGYSEIGGFLKPTTDIASRFKTAYDQREAEQEVLGGMASARRKREKLYDSEVALFRGRSGFDSSSLKRSTTGSY